MDETLSLIREKKRKIEIDFKLCFIQKNSKQKIIVKAATIDFIDKILNNIKERFKFKDVSVSQFVERLGDKNSPDIVNNNGFYHRLYQKLLKESKKDLTKQSVKLNHLQVNLKKVDLRNTITVSTVLEKPMYNMSRNRWTAS